MALASRCRSRRVPTTTRRVTWLTLWRSHSTLAVRRCCCSRRRRRRRPPSWALHADRTHRRSVKRRQTHTQRRRTARAKRKVSTTIPTTRRRRRARARRSASLKRTIATRLTRLGEQVAELTLFVKTQRVPVDAVFGQFGFQLLRCESQRVSLRKTFSRNINEQDSLFFRCIQMYSAKLLTGH